MKNKILFVVLGLLITLFIFVVVFVTFYKYPKYNNEKMDLISSYLLLDSNIYDEWYDNIKTKRVVTEFDDFDINKIILSYLVNNYYFVSDYSYEDCSECYNSFSKFDNIKFFNSKDVENVSKLLVGRNIKKITQKDIVSYNTLYYNTNIDMYYANCVSYNKQISSLIKLKEYKQLDNYLYFDYYYFDVLKLYNFENNLENQYVSLLDIDGKVIVDSVDYNILVDDYVIDYNSYNDLSFIRYSFVYNKKNKQYVLDEVKIVKE